MALWMERQRLRERDEREGAGEHLWTEDIPREARVKVSALWNVLQDAHHDERLRRWLKVHLQVQVGLVAPPLSTPYDLQARPASTDEVLTVLESLYEFWDTEGGRTSKNRKWSEVWEGTINEIFNSHSVAFKMVDGQFLPYTDDAVYQATVEPALRLLISKKFDGAQQAFRNALKEIQHGEPADAITDAGTALQETLAALGVEGKQLGDQLKEAKKSGLLAGRDQPLLDGIDGFMRWVASERNQNGDAHAVTDANLDDAWLAVHVVGALILRLSGGALRGC